MSDAKLKTIMPIQRRNVGIPQFLIKLSAILNNKSIEIMRWSQDGRSFQILDIEALEKNILKQYYSHSKWASFQRQLNYFCFKKWTKTQTDICTFSHPDFLKNEPARMKYICRKNKPERPGIRKEEAVRGTAKKIAAADNSNLINSLRAKYQSSDEPTRMKYICRKNKPERPGVRKAEAARGDAKKISELRAKYAASLVRVKKEQPSVELFASISQVSHFLIVKEESVSAHGKHWLDVLFDEKQQS